MYKTEKLSLSSTKENALYKTLLLFYPESYRKRFGQEMLIVFQDMYEEEIAKRGKAGIRFWILLLIDITENVMTQHFDMIRKYGVKNYLQQALHINRYNVIGVILLLPFILLLGSDFISRVIQGDLSHYNKTFYNSLSHTILYSQYRAQAPLLWTILVFFPILAVILNLIPFVFSLRQHKKKLSVGTLLFTNPLAVIIMGTGFLFVVIAFGHDAIDCFVNHLFSNGLENIGRTISVCRNA